MHEAKGEREGVVASKIRGSVKLLQRQVDKTTQILGQNARLNEKLGLKRHVDKLDAKLKHLPTVLAKTRNSFNRDKKRATVLAETKNLKSERESLALHCEYC